MATGRSGALRRRFHHALYVLASALPLPIRRRVMFLYFHRRVPNFRAPRTFSEKVNWRVLHDRSERLSWTCDKLAMKEHIAELEPRARIPATYWVGTDVAGLAHAELPDRWVLKANHRSGTYFLGEGRPDVTQLRRITAGWLGAKQGRLLGEWAYTQARPLIFAEERLGGDEAPPDYKFHVFDGVVDHVELHLDRLGDHATECYSLDWKPLGVGGKRYASPVAVPPPRHLAEMLRIAARIGAAFDYMRVDLYDTPDGVYFGETSPYPGSGLDPYDPVAFDERLGTLWKLPAV